eukprot:4345608-Amphidinium_carterae.1
MDQPAKAVTKLSGVSLVLVHSGVLGNPLSGCRQFVYRAGRPAILTALLSMPAGGCATSDCKGAATTARRIKKGLAHRNGNTISFERKLQAALASRDSLDNSTLERQEQAGAQ